MPDRRSQIMCICHPRTPARSHSHSCLNRHDAFTTTLAAWRATGNPIYSSYFDALLIDWVLHLPCPDAKSAGAACVPLGLNGTACSWDSPPGAQACKTGTMESPWRSLEMGIRMGGPWPVAFFGFQGSAEFSVTARVLAVLAVAEHFAALMVDGGHPGHGTPNWCVCRMRNYAPGGDCCMHRTANRTCNLQSIMQTGK